MNKLIKIIDQLTLSSAAIGGLIILVQILWTSYGVGMRYIFNNPDGMVTEATALLLFPVAFLGLAYALKVDAYPKVTFLLDALSPVKRRYLQSFNLGIMFFVGVFFSIVSVDATFKSFASGASSEILLWPRYIFWAPSAFAIVLFTCLCFIKIICLWNEKYADRVE